MSYIGLDIGGSNVRFAVTNDWNLNNLEYRKRPFIRSGNPQNEVEENICSIIDAVPDCIEGLSISLAAVMDRSRKKVKTWPNDPSWNHYDLVQHLSSRYNVPIVIEDDANCGAICEYHILKDSVRNMAYITIGTGIGCGLILNGSLFTGENGFAGELGHIYMGYASNDSMCSCGNQSCFQAVASGPAVLRKYNSAAKTCFTSLEEVHRKYLHGDPIAVKCLSDMIDCISGVIYNLAMCLDIPLFIMGGGVSNMGTDLILQIESKVNERLKFFERKISVKQAHLGDFSGVYGALQLLKKHVLMGKGE